MKYLLIGLALLTPGCPAPLPADADLTMGNQDGGGPSPDLLAGGPCNPKCSGLTPLCNAKSHCVGCTTDGDCPMGSYCKIVSDAIASCTPGCMSDDRCPNGQKCCGSRCSDVTADPANCGMCGTACAGMHASSKCVASKCTAGACDPGWGDCNMNPADGCEANLHSDVNNCTACGMTCSLKNAYVGCADGCYVAACKWGFDHCTMNLADGCETSVLSDRNNCGACGKSCLGIPNAMAGCTNGSCVISSCSQGFFDCDMMVANGCETNIYTDVKNCGQCGNVCGNGLICSNGGCTCPQCNFPNATSKCINNVCMLDQCNMGYADCDHIAANGCEVNIWYDKLNCNGCGNVCPQGQGCGKGVCGVNVNQPFANWKGIDWFKVMVNGAMTDDNIFNACQGVGLIAPCQTMGNCNYNDLKCKMATPEMSCGNPMMNLSQGICNGAQPSGCPALYGVFQYMGNKWQGGCGAQMGQWCVTGNNAMNQFALCIQ